MASKDERETLITQDKEVYGGQDEVDPPGNGKDGNGNSAKPPDISASTKRERLQRNPSLEKVEEDTEKPKAKKHGCPIGFGVKSYLHHFYERHHFKDPSVYEEEDDFRYLLNPGKRRRRCTSIWWKVFVWIGANFLVFGFIGVMVGYLVPQRPVIIGSIADNIEIIDREAMSFNFNLDVCKLVGVILFCFGGLTLTVALMFPSVLYNYCDEEHRDPAFKVKVGSKNGDNETDEKPPMSPTGSIVPASQTIDEVQPERIVTESIVTQEGMKSLKD